jgi:hypothetical protein
MATIANQIQRISNSRIILGEVGQNLKLSVPSGTTYWDNNSKSYITTTAATLLQKTDPIDKIAAAFNTI